MNGEIALILGQDGVVNGAIYALVALALVLVYAVTRVIFVPQGEYVTFGALSLASLQLGKVPGTAWLLLTAAGCVAVVELVEAWRQRSFRSAVHAVLAHVALPGAIVLLTVWLAPTKPVIWVQILLTLGLVVPLGPITYRLAFQPVASASVLVLLIIGVAVHFVLVGAGLAFFGAEGSRTTPIIDAQFDIGSLSVTAQSLSVVGASVLLIAALYAFFEYAILGKALRATAVNRIGAKVVGISPSFAGKLCFALAAGMGAVSGMLVASVTTIYYDSGFLIGLKGFVGAIIGGLVSYPIAAAGALLVGLLESFSSFWASAFKEVIVFTLIIPVLLWRSLTSHVIEEDEE
jgi:branched-subunit amino acid ABC-type transport system permease component